MFYYYKIDSGRVARVLSTREALTDEEEKELFEIWDRQNRRLEKCINTIKRRGRSTLAQARKLMV